MKKLFFIMAALVMAFSGCHKDPQNGGNDNGGGNGGNGGGGNGPTPTETTFTVTFDANGGGGTMQSQIFNYGEARTLNPNMFTRGGYFFASWNTKYDGSGTSYTDKQSITVSQDMVLYAQWKKDTFTVTFDANGGIGEMEQQTFHFNVAQVLTANTYTRANYVFAGWNTAGDGSGTNYIDGQEITISEDLTLYAQWRIVPQGAIGGLFSVSDSKRVFFSQGNLQYQASTSTWRFAENQWDYIGDANTNISSSYSGWIDLFGWGTGNNPTNSPTNYSYNSFTDWGSKPISNGGNQANRWRTLTSDEWSFLMFNRSTSSGIRFAKATVNGVTGVIILPDDWSSSYYTLGSTNSDGASFSANTITSSNWTNNLEAHGAVFLPAAGYRDASSVNVVGSYGFYWSSTPNGSDYAYHYAYSYYLYFNGSDLSVYYYNRYRGQSVRLVAEE